MNALDELRTLIVPTLANAVEVFGVVAANTGYNSTPLRCHFPAFGMCAGYAVTLHATTNVPLDAAPKPIDEPEYWRWLASITGPKIVVLERLQESVLARWPNGKPKGTR